MPSASDEQLAELSPYTASVQESIQDKEKAVQGSSVTTAATAPYQVPDGGAKAWLSVGGFFLFNLVTWASNSAYAVYLAHYLEYGTFEEANTLDYAAIGGLTFGAGLVISPIVRLIIRTLGIRITIALGGVCQFAGIMLAAFSTKLWQLYLTQGLLMGFSLALIMMPCTSIIPQWFRKKRALAISLGASGSGVGGIIFNLALQQIVNDHGLKWAFITQAIVCAACTTLGLILLRTNPAVPMKLALWNWKIMSYGCYWIFAGYVALTLLGYVVLMYNLADFTISLGYSAHQGSIVSCMISVGIIFGRPMMGFIADKRGPVTITIFVHLFVSLLCFAMWIPARNYATAIAFAVMQGATMGTLWVVFAPIAVRLFGLRNIDVCLAMTWIVIGVFGVVSPVIGIKLRASVPASGIQVPTQYVHPAIWCGVVYFVAAVMLWFTRAYLLARDVEAAKVGSLEDSDELHIKVAWSAWFKKLFALSPVRTV